jgi:tRNA A-37 threonylcarbamoyl transferase component Bud32/tetratricopeptide (TPR) repeat protein
MTERLEWVRGELADRYRIERELGRGGAATVYLAEDLAQQRQVAVKVLHPELVEAVGGQRFLREIRLAASLHHPHLVAIHSWGETKGLFYFVAPYLPDGSLRARLQRERQLSVDEALRITREVADALGHVHDHAIVHRDVKPENILFAGKHACLADFGIARAVETAVGDTLTSTGLVVGTPAYMSPEQASGERAVDARSDQYSLACVLYEMLAGMPPFVGATVQSVIAQRFAHPPSPLTFYRPNVSPAIEDALSRALAIAPADRFDSVRDFVVAFDRPATSAIRIDPGVRFHKLRRRWFMAGAAAAMIVIGLFGFNQAYDRFGGSFFATSDIPSAAEPGLRSARGSRARSAYLRGHRAFARGEFESAYLAFSQATAAEPAFTHGHLWRAQIGAFSGIGDDKWTDAARRAVANARKLSRRETILASALFALGERRHPEACAAFERARQLDSLDFLVWYGLGECRFLDSAVVPDQRSRSGWRFRSSYHTAAAAYFRAADLDARSYDLPIYARLSGMLKMQRGYLRWGTRPDDATKRYAGFPELAADTLTFTPEEVDDFVPYTGDPRNHRAAWEQHGAVLLAFTRSWLSTAPQNPTALEAYADVLEARGDLSDEVDPLSALSAVRSARRSSPDRVHRLRLAGREVRILLKRDQFREARTLADSLLRAWPAPNYEAAETLHGLAALLGRVRLTARLGTLRDREEYVADVRLALPLVESVARFRAYAALGVCRSLDQLYSDVLQKIETYVDRSRAPRVAADITRDPARWSAECFDQRTPLIPDPGMNSTLRAQQAFMRGRPGLARKLLDSIAEAGIDYKPAEKSIGYVFEEARLRAAVGDTSIAIRMLDPVLQGLSVQSASILRWIYQAAALPRAMALRADLAAAQGEHAVANRWARSVLQLWAGADQELAPVVARMQLLANKR